MVQKQSNKGIWQYVTQIFALSSFIFTAGIAYGEFKTMKQKQADTETRLQRQYELFRDINSEVLKIKEQQAYERGLRDNKKAP